jgi:hypothetical protein
MSIIYRAYDEITIVPLDNTLRFPAAVKTDLTALIP